MKKQHEAIRTAIIRYIGDYGFPPTVREIGNAVGLKSTSSVQTHLKKMEELGILESVEGFSHPRAIRVPGYIFVEEAPYKKMKEKSEESKIENFGPDVYVCPICKRSVDLVWEYCPWCGQHIAK